MSAHFMEQCSCGNMIRQCRCPDKNKSVTVVQSGCIECQNKRKKAHAEVVPIEEYEKRIGVEK